MIFYAVIVLSLLGALAWSVNNYRYNKKYRAHRTVFLPWLMPVLVPIIFVLLIAAPLRSGDFTGEANYKISEAPLVALTTSSEISGSFFLGSGRIDENQVFSYLRKEPDGAATLQSHLAEDSFVYETSDVLAHVEYWTGCYDDGILFPWTICSRWEDARFYVPEGSVISDYQVTP